VIRLVAYVLMILQIVILVKLAIIPFVREIRALIILGNQIRNLTISKEKADRRFENMFNKIALAALHFKFVQKEKNIYSRSQNEFMDDSQDSDLVNVHVMNVSNDFENKIPRSRINLSNLSVSED